MTDTMEVLQALVDRIEGEITGLTEQIEALTDKREQRERASIAVHKAMDELRELEADHDDQPSAPEAIPEFLQPVSEPVVSEPEQGAAKTGPWSDDFLSECYEDQLRGKTVKQIADERGVAYNHFSSALKKFREGLDCDDEESSPAAEKIAPAASKHERAAVEIDGRKVLDPDPDRASSGWSFEDDIQLLEDLGNGMKAKRAAELFSCDVETIKQRYSMLVPSRSFEDQGKMLKALRALDEAVNFTGALDAFRHAAEAAE